LEVNLKVLKPIYFALLVLVAVAGCTEWGCRLPKDAFEPEEVFLNVPAELPGARTEVVLLEIDDERKACFVEVRHIATGQAESQWLFVGSKLPPLDDHGVSGGVVEKIFEKSILLDTSYLKTADEVERLISRDPKG